MKRSLLGIITLLVGVLLVGNVYAQEITFQSTDHDAGDNTINDGDVIILKDGTYTGDITITKSITIKAENSGEVTINGKITVNSGTVVLDGLKITDDDVIVDVEGKSNLTIQNTTIQYTGYDDTFEQNGASGIKLGKSGDGSTVAIKNSTIVAKYAVWVNGQGNNVTIDNSHITGWAALDITNGSGTQTLAVGNKITVTGSTIEGHGIYNGETDEYGTIVIGGQKDLKLTIQSSTVTTTVGDGQTVNAHDLFYYSNSDTGYKPSENSQIEVYNSTLSTDGKNGSVIYDLGTDDNYEGNNAIYISNDTKTIGTLYGTNESHIYVTIYDSNKNSHVVVIEKGTKLAKAELTKYESVSGYTFDGWYLDEKLTTKYEEKELSSDTALYPKFTKIEKQEVKEEEKQKDPAPGTGDVFPMALIGIMTLGLAGTYTFRKLHN